MVDTVVITSPENVPAPEGHDQAMIELVDKTLTPTPEEPPVQTEDRPEWLPEKFKSAEDLAKAYAELEQKLSGKGAEDEPVKPEGEPEPKQEDPAAVLEAKGLSISDFQTEFAANGVLSPESYQKLADAGFDKATVDAHIAGQVALAAQWESEIKTTVGGDEKYAEMTEWAKANLNAGEIDAYNRAVSSGDSDLAKLAVLGLASKFDAANGSAPERHVAGDKSGVSADVFESTAQLTEAMSDPRYRTDPAYRDKVAQKLARSTIF